MPMDHAPTWDWSALAEEFLQHSVDFDRRQKDSTASSNDRPGNTDNTGK
jgi:hypothetical protein